MAFLSILSLETILTYNDLISIQTLKHSRKQREQLNKPHKNVIEIFMPSLVEIQIFPTLLPADNFHEVPTTRHNEEPRDSCGKRRKHIKYTTGITLAFIYLSSDIPSNIRPGKLCANSPLV